MSEQEQRSTVPGGWAGAQADFPATGRDRPLRISVIADDPAHVREATDAVAAAGARMIASVGWIDAAQTLPAMAPADLLVVEAQGVSSATLDAMLPRIDTLARSTDARVLVALDIDQIDPVSAQLFGPHVDLLCAPSLVQRVATLCLARPAAVTTLHDVSRDGESERLRRLNEEVARIAQTLAHLTRREELVPGSDRPGRLGDRRTGYAAETIDTAGTIDPQHVRQAIRARRLRDQFFNTGLFEDPAWDMLLDLFAAELEQRQVSVSSLCIAAAVAPTTALRWIGKLSEAGLFERHPDPFDRRRAFMGLSERARTAMQHYWAAITQTGLSSA
jgi:hypothetical protein